METSLSELTTVMIVDDHDVVRVGLKQILEQTDEFEVVGEAADGMEAVSVAAEVSPDVVLMDVIMPNKDGVEACREIMESNPQVRVVILTASTEEDAVVESVAAGATGYLQKDSGRDKLLATIRDVARGELRVPAEVVTRVFADIHASAKVGDAATRTGLTKRARDTRILFYRNVLLPHSRGERDKAGDRSERHLWNPDQAAGRDDAGAGALGRAKWPAR